MKTETQITEENIKIYKASGNIIKISVEILEEHKTSCQRFLEFLGQFGYTDISHNSKFDLLEKKTADLKQAIKLYDEAGI